MLTAKLLSGSRVQLKNEERSLFSAKGLNKLQLCHLPRVRTMTPLCFADKSQYHHGEKGNQEKL